MMLRLVIRVGSAGGDVQEGGVVEVFVLWRVGNKRKMPEEKKRPRIFTSEFRGEGTIQLHSPLKCDADRASSSSPASPTFSVSY